MAGIDFVFITVNPFLTSYHSCSEYRGMSLKTDALLNLTTPQVYSVSAANNRPQSTSKAGLSTIRQPDKSLSFRPSSGDKETRQVQANYRTVQRRDQPNAWAKRTDGGEKQAANGSQVAAQAVFTERKVAVQTTPDERKVTKSGATTVNIQIMKRAMPAPPVPMEDKQADDMTRQLKDILGIGGADTSSKSKLATAQHLLDNFTPDGQSKSGSSN